MMIHAAIHWPEVSDASLWPMTVQHAAYLYNRVPDPSTGLAPVDIFTRQPSVGHSLGCTTYMYGVVRFMFLTRHLPTETKSANGNLGRFVTSSLVFLQDMPVRSRLYSTLRLAPSTRLTMLCLMIGLQPCRQVRTTDLISHPTPGTNCLVILVFNMCSTKTILMSQPKLTLFIRLIRWYTNVALPSKPPWIPHSLPFRYLCRRRLSLLVRLLKLLLSRLFSFELHLSQLTMSWRLKHPLSRGSNRFRGSLRLKLIRRLRGSLLPSLPNP